jgi:hypothetical protein
MKKGKREDKTEKGKKRERGKMSKKASKTPSISGPNPLPYTGKECLQSCKLSMADVMRKCFHLKLSSLQFNVILYLTPNSESAKLIRKQRVLKSVSATGRQANLL